MAGYVPCEGTKKTPVDVWFSPSRSDGLGFTQGKTFGKCCKCGYRVVAHGDARRTLSVPRHKPRV